jgi:hypothetical protein
MLLYPFAASENLIHNMMGTAVAEISPRILRLPATHMRHVLESGSIDDSLC